MTNHIVIEIMIACACIISFFAGWFLAMRKLGYRVNRADEMVIKITVETKQAIIQLNELKEKLAAIKPLAE